jgi:hypothetical protein
VQARDSPGELETDHVPNENEAANEIRMAQKHKAGRVPIEEDRAVVLDVRRTLSAECGLY